MTVNLVIGRLITIQVHFNILYNLCVRFAGTPVALLANYTVRYSLTILSQSEKLMAWHHQVSHSSIHVPRTDGMVQIVGHLPGDAFILMTVPHTNVTIGGCVPYTSKQMSTPQCLTA